MSFHCNSCLAWCASWPAVFNSICDFVTIHFTAIVKHLGVVVENITQLQSPFWHNLCYGSTNVTYRNLNISTKSIQPNVTAANTDGIDIYRSSYVTFEDSIVNNGDDCVSFKPNCTN